MAIQNFLRLTSSQDNNVITLTQVGTPSAVSIEYRTDLNQTWQSYTIGTQLTLFNGSWVEFRNTTGTFSTNASNYYKFTMTGRTQASGDVNSLLDWRQDSPALKAYCYASMFYKCSSLTTAPELPATTTAMHCYKFMFRDCSSLTTAPVLPATSLSNYCYNGMFQNCKSLTTAPQIPPVAGFPNSCYYQTFDGCSSLNSVVFGASIVPARSATSSWLNGVSAIGTFYYTDENLNVSGFSRDVTGIPPGWSIQYLGPKPSLVFYLNGKAVSTLTINGRNVAKLTHN